MRENKREENEYKPKLRLQSPAKRNATNTKDRFSFLQATQNIVLSTNMLQAQTKEGGSGLSLSHKTVELLRIEN